jgi:hypothetical protein
MKLPSQTYLQSRIDYNPQTGEARWKPVDESYGPTYKKINLKAGSLLNTKKIYLDGYTLQTARVLFKIYYGCDATNPIKFRDGNNTNLSIANITINSPNIKATSILKYFSSIPSDASKILDYEHSIGTFIWKSRDNPTFNTRFAGKAAGYLNSSSGYYLLTIYNTPYLAHRVAWYLYYGVDPANYLIDHVDGNKANNTITNLRLANYSFNAQVSKTVTFIPKNNRYESAIKVNGRRVVLGAFNTELQARTAYESALQKLKPVYNFNLEEQAQLDTLYSTYPNCSKTLQHACHALQVKALNHYIDAAVVQTPK